MVDHSNNTVYLVTGANRGIGLALVQLLSTRPNTTVIATARNPIPAPSPFEGITPHPSGSAVIPLLLDDAKDEMMGSSTLASRLLQSAGVRHVNVVVANAGAASGGFKSVFDTSEEDYKDDFEVNTLGPIRLFQAVWGLLGEGVKGKGGKFVVVGSSVGSVGGLVTAGGEMEGGVLVCGSYGLSKAGVHWWVMKLRAELKMQEKEVVVGVVHPGWVQTRMGQGLADAIDKLTMENSGQFWRWDGGVLPW
ncbi:hypothetical protein QBC41DRAFT_363066 [Cercophora samala]|uniref:NAD(P)-binding protein n=1 Tax=Cercophora samala TaxID=330535 RepID=A0AA40DE18_9PEZI|nr:hypothetical protein QBC41DRAFT_363066 [Cercophora samala]